MSSDPNAKIASARVPVVSDKYVNQPVSRWSVFSYVLYLVVVLTLLVGGITWGAPIVLGKVKSFVNPPISHNTAVPTLTPVPDVQADCLKQLPQPPVTSPVLFFCSPRYLGNVGGPFGTHIMLVGANFPSQPTGWFMPKRPVTPDDTLTECSSNTQTDCQSLPNPSLIPPSDKKQVQQSTFFFSLVWQDPFPSTKGDYFITAQVGNKFVTTTLRKFTLTTSQPPCITISPVGSPAQTDETSDCPHNGVPLNSSASIDIKGKNWLLGWMQGDPLDMQIEIVASCTANCDKPLFDETVTNEELSSDGTFPHRVSLPPGVTGKYTVMAWNKTLVDDSLGAEKSTIVNDHALMFGADKNGLILNIA